LSISQVLSLNYGNELLLTSLKYLNSSRFTLHLILVDIDNVYEHVAIVSPDGETNTTNTCIAGGNTALFVSQQLTVNRTVLPMINNTYFVLRDHLQSTEVIVALNGEIVERYNYGVYLFLFQNS
jgi:hypothetical protein